MKSASEPGSKSLAETSGATAKLAKTTKTPHVFFIVIIYHITKTRPEKSGFRSCFIVKPPLAFPLFDLHHARGNPDEGRGIEFPPNAPIEAGPLERVGGFAFDRFHAGFGANIGLGYPLGFIFVSNGHPAMHFAINGERFPLPVHRADGFIKDYLPILQLRHELEQEAIYKTTLLRYNISLTYCKGWLKMKHLRFRRDILYSGRMRHIWRSPSYYL